jgi:hypothetical protein
MLVCRTPEAVASAISVNATRVIAIDGFHASGKTRLARALSEKLNIPAISADDYLTKYQGAFFDYLKLDEISAALQSHERCIFEGVCCLQVLQEVGVRASTLVYVKRMAIWGWADEDELDSFISTSSGNRGAISSTAEMRGPLQIGLRNLWEEVAQYHHQYRSHEIADLVYQRSAT